MAEGISGGEAIRRQLDDVAGRVGGHRKTFHGRLNYMTRSKAGRAVLQEYGLDVTERTMSRWKSGGKAAKANRAIIDAAYEEYRRENVIKTMKNRLQNSGNGTRVEIHPTRPSDPKRARANINTREKVIRDWDGLIGAWEAGDDNFFEDYWDDVMDDLGSEGGAYATVAGIGF